MPTDSAQAYYVLDGLPIDNIRNVRIAANGGVSTIRRGITRSKVALGRRRSQKPDYTITFDRDVLEGAQDIDWYGFKQDQTSFTFTEIADADTYNYEDCEVETIEKSTDDDGNVTETVTVSSLDVDKS
jgi:hypothetical protein